MGEWSTAATRQWTTAGIALVFGVAFLAIPLFLLSPRSEQPDWDPLARFGVRSQRNQTRIGFSEEIDLGRAGRLVPDEAVAFHVETRNSVGELRDLLETDALFRGSVLDRYERGIWRVEAGFPGGLIGNRGNPEYLSPGPQAIEVRFLVPRRTGGLFLLDPQALSPDKRNLPIRLIGETVAKGPIFLNVEGNAIPMPMAYLSLPEYRYAQYVLPDRSRERSRSVRYRDSYLLRLIRTNVEDLDVWARGILLGSSRTPEELRQLLQVHERDLPPRWWEPIARTLSEHLSRSREFRYSLQSEVRDPQIDPTLDFLQNVRSGPCDRYASALALMLRSMGIPARIVKGYRGLERVREGEYIVRQSNAHAWVEALVPANDGSNEYDWLTLDPTPEGESSLADLTRWLQRQQTGGQEFFRELVVNYNARSRAAMLERLTSPDTLVYLLPWGLGAVVVALLFWLYRLRRRAQASKVVLGIQGLGERLQRLLARQGLHRIPNATAQEFAEQARRWLQENRLVAWIDLPHQVAAAFYRVRYGQQSLSESDLQALSERVDHFEQALRSFRPGTLEVRA